MIKLFKTFGKDFPIGEEIIQRADDFLCDFDIESCYYPDDDGFFDEGKVLKANKLKKVKLPNSVLFRPRGKPKKQQPLYKVPEKAKGKPKLKPKGKIKGKVTLKEKPLSKPQRKRNGKSLSKLVIKFILLTINGF